MKPLQVFLLVFLMVGCSGLKEEKEGKLKAANETTEELTRVSEDRLFVIPESEPKELQPYPWERAYVGEHPRITKEFFRCKGSCLNPVRKSDDKTLCDCNGGGRHSLPLMGGEEGVYPVLLELLNYVQEETGRRVVITCGHRCPEHNSYADPTKFNETSKHMIGGEVDFYVEGLEERPQEVVDLLLKFYADCSEDSCRQFRRYDKGNTNVATYPWYNKEVFIKLFRSDEGRDLDNRHPYPYICIQVRYDRDLDERVTYTWKSAHKNYRR